MQCRISASCHPRPTIVKPPTNSQMKAMGGLRPCSSVALAECETPDLECQRVPFVLRALTAV
jgi:hypothetical protein